MKRTPKYVAIIIIKGIKSIVFPRSKKTNTFPTIQKAESALDKFSRRFDFETRGIIKSTVTGEIVSTMAL